ncbi:MAG TPA: glycosyltransferase family 2 protein [Acidimicrobiales bacterium]|nr:glycosyltransferase family 2 protein [Acidimicrobiales bacterium]
MSDQPRGAPWTLLCFLGVGVVVVAQFGLSALVTAVAFAVEFVFVVFFVRHLAFASSAMAAAPHDLAAPAFDTGFTPRVSVLVACKNEESVVDALATSLLDLDYPSDGMELCIIDDGSTDATAEVLAARAASDPRLRVVTRPPDAGGGKSGALNAALAAATGEVIVVFDADHSPRRDCVRRLVRHFADPQVAAAQGRCVIRNGDDSLLARLIAVDYLAGYLVNEYGRQSLFRLPAYGGANCAVRASELRALGGWNPNTVTEDTDLTLRLLLRGSRVCYDVTAVDEEEAVVTLERYWRQRYRWARGHQQCWRDYRGAVWRSPRLSLAEKIETTMFLLVFHLPVASAVGIGVLLLWLAGVVHPTDVGGIFMLWTLLFLGPLLELGGALLVARADRRQALALVYFLPVFFVSIALCAKAWVDGVVGRPYAWVKTARRAEPSVAT